MKKKLRRLRLFAGISCIIMSLLLMAIPTPSMASVSGDEVVSGNNNSVSSDKNVDQQEISQNDLIQLEWRLMMNLQAM